MDDGQIGIFFLKLTSYVCSETINYLQLSVKKKKDKVKPCKFQLYFIFYIILPDSLTHFYSYKGSQYFYFRFFLLFFFLDYIIKTKIQVYQTFNAIYKTPLHLRYIL